MSTPPEDTKPVASQPERMGSPGASTFGFETMLGKLIVDMGLVTDDELEDGQETESDESETKSDEDESKDKSSNDSSEG